MSALRIKSREFQTLETTCVLALAFILLGIGFNLLALIYVSAGLLFIGLFLKRLGNIVAQGWMRFGTALGVLNNRIILSVIFYLILTPVAVLYRLTHGDFMKVRDSQEEKTFWNERNHEYRPADLDRQW